MKTLLASIALLASVNAFAVSECVNIISNTPYKGTISSESRELSYNDCPESVLVNDRFVAQLFMVQDSAGEATCGYKFAGASFVCKNK